MADKDALSERRKHHEDDYFRKKDQELIDRMRQAAAAEQQRRELGAKMGLTDPALVDELAALGFTPDTVTLLPLIPIVQMAWAEGGVTPAERELVVSLARARGVAEDSAADRQLSDWLAHEPGPDVLAQATRLIRALLDADAGQAVALSADELIRHCESIASASGGLFGIGRVSSEERVLLAQIGTALKARA